MALSYDGHLKTQKLVAAQVDATEGNIEEHEVGNIEEHEVKPWEIGQEPC